MELLSLLLLNLFYLTLARSVSPGHGIQAPLGSEVITIRPIVEADLDDVTTVVIDAFSPGAANKYLSIGGDELANYTWKCVRKAVGEQFKQKPDNTFANVISVPQKSFSSHERRERVVAIAVWRIFNGHEGDNLELAGKTSCLMSGRCSENLDTNMTRAEDFQQQFSAAEEKYIHGLNQSQLYLELLATHPDWDGHGFGASHCRWGMNRAAAMKVPITLIATPAGYPLYDSLGFDSIANITINMLDNLGELWFEYMRWDGADLVK